MSRLTYKLNVPTTAMRNENGERIIVTIPANALITVVQGDPHGSGIIKVWYRGQILSVFAIDLRGRGERKHSKTA